MKNKINSIIGKTTKAKISLWVNYLVIPLLLCATLGSAVRGFHLALQVEAADLLFTDKLPDVKIELKGASSSKPAVVAAVPKPVPKKEVPPPAKKEEKKEETDEEVSYRKLRLWETTKMFEEAGIPITLDMGKDFAGQSYTLRDFLLAHLLRECGQLSEYCGWTKGKESNDGGWAIGMAQWHLCYREWDWLKENGWAYYDSTGRKQCRWNIDIEKVRNKFFAEHPEMKEWRNQVKRYIREIKGYADGKIEHFGESDANYRQAYIDAVDVWNANPKYLGQVRGQITVAKKVLQGTID